MNQVTKFPDMRPAKKRDAAALNLPTPAGYRRSVPAFPSTDPGIDTRRVERKRLVLWFGVAVALHAALLLGLWLTPPLRLKWGPSPDAWVQVVSLPKKPPDAPLPHATNPPPIPAKAKGHKVPTAVDPGQPPTGQPPK